MLLSEITISQVNQNDITGFPATKKRQHITNTVNINNNKVYFRQLESSIYLIIPFEKNGGRILDNIASPK